MAGIHFDITGENKNFLNALSGAESGVKKTTNAIEQYGSQIEGMFEKIKVAAGAALAGFTVKGFAEKVALVRGEFQQLEVAFQTMLGSAEQARSMMDDLTRLAATTPFDLQGVATGAKQLLAYGMQAEDITDTLRRLGDVAAGLGIQLGDLTYLYGTTMAQGRLYTQDLNQFTGRGIPMIRELAAQFGVAESEVKDLVTAGKVGFPEVQKVIESLTNEGGQFGGLMEAQSHTIVGQISNIEDSISMMFNDMGKSSEGAINTALSGVSYAVDHYKEFGSVILGIVAAYGEWKAAAMVVNAWNSMLLNQTAEIEAARQASLTTIAAKYTSETTTASTAAVEQNTIARNANKSAIDAEIASIAAALQAEIAEAEANYNSATSKAAQAAVAMEEAQINVVAAEQRYQAALMVGDATAIENAELELNTAVVEQNAAQKTLLAARENVHAAATAKETAATKLNSLQTEVDTVQKKANTTATGLWVAITNTATKAVRGLTAAVAANPMGALLVGVTTVLSLIPMFTSSTEEATAEVTRFGEEAVKQTNNVNTLMSVLETTSDTSKVHKDAMDELVKVYDEYGIKIDDEQDKLQQLIGKHDELIQKIREEGEERQKANLMQSYNEGMDKALEEMRKQWVEAYQNAEYNGTGVFDDLDANDYQEAAEQIAIVAQSIAQSEIEQLQAIIESGGEVTQEQIKAAIATAKSKIEEQSQQIAGAPLYNIDVDYEDILEGYTDKILNLSSARQTLVAQIKNTKSSMEEEAKSVDVSSLSFADLIKKAYGAQEAVESVGNTDGTPTIDTTPANDATKAVQDTISNLSKLNNTTAMPLVKTSSLDNALLVTNSLLRNLAALSTSQPFTNTSSKLPKFGLNVGGPQLKLNSNFNFGSYSYNPLSSNEQTDAIKELSKRISEAQSDSAVDALLKEVKSAIEESEYGSTERKELQRLQKQLQDRKSSNSLSSKTSTQQKKETDKRKESAKKVAEELAEIESQNQKTTIELMEEGTAKKLAQIDNEYQERKAQIAKQAQGLAEENKKAGLYGSSSLQIDGTTVNGLTEEQKSALEQSLNLNEQSKAKQTSETYQEEKEAMWAYLQEYGTFEQQRLAIAEEYAERIRKAQGNEWEVKSLERQRDSQLASISAQSLAMDIDWSQTFSGVGNVLSEIGRETLAKIQDYMQTDEYKGLSADQKKSYQDFAKQLQQEGAGQSTSAFNFGIWGEVSKNVKEYQDSVIKLTAAQEAHKSAVQDLQDAQEALTNATTDAEKELAQGQVDAAQSAVDSTAADLSGAEQQKNTANQKLVTSTNQATNGIKNFTSYLNEMSNGSLYGFANGITKLVTSLSSGSDGIGKSLEQLGSKVGGIVGAILQIIDALGDDPDQFIDDLLTNIGNAVESIIADLPNIIGTVFEGVGSIITGVFSGIASWFGGGGESDKNLKDDIEKMTSVNEELTNAVEKLSEIMEEGLVSEATETYEQQIAALESAMANTQEMMYRSLNASSRRSHSSRHEVDTNMDASDWERITQLLNDSGLFDGVISEANDFFNLTSEQMDYIATYAPDLYAKIKELADDGMYDAATYMDDYIAYYEELNELTEAWQEKMTNTDFDTIRDEFKDLMSDMESNASDFAESFEDIMKDAVMEIMMDTYNDRLQAWYEQFADSISNDGALSVDEQEELRKQWDALAEEAIAARDAMYDTMGWSDTYNQEASSGSWESMSEETAQELNGRFTAVQIHTSDTAERMLTTINLLTAMSTVQTAQNAILAEVRNLMITSNSYLEDMVKYAKLTYNQFGTKLDNIVTNTKNL